MENRNYVTMNNELDIVRRFIIQERWEYDFELKPETSIQEDLKIYGDDASEILLKFCKKFNIAYSDFNFDDYFKSEPSWTDFIDKKKEFKKFTISDLMIAMNTKKLI